jgi:hypothetical protein
VCFVRRDDDVVRRAGETVLHLPKAWRRSDQAWQLGSDSPRAYYLLEGAAVVFQRR